jgi:hypothetical protein
MSEVELLMKSCQRGVGGFGALNEAHDIMAECYGMLGKLSGERDAALAECERLRAALTEISAMQSHECTIGQNLKDAVRVACDALSAKP